MIQPLPSRRVSYEEFLKIEATDERRLEFLDGVVVAQAEPSRCHEFIVSNLSEHLGPAVRAAGCRYVTRGAIWSHPRRMEMKPDWIVICDQRDLEGDGPELTRSRYRFPRVVVEVLSPSNTTTEMIKKFDTYSITTSVELYLIVNSMAQQIWSYVRSAEGLVASRFDDVITTPFGRLSVASVYADSGVPQLETEPDTEPE